MKPVPTWSTTSDFRPESPKTFAPSWIDERRSMLRAEVAEATKRAAAELRAAGLSTRDVGEILDVSGAGVAQIERAARDNGGREAQRSIR